MIYGNRSAETHMKDKPQILRINQNICRILVLSNGSYFKYIYHWNIINISFMIALWL